MNILHINTHDITGGAGRAAYRLHQGLQRLGHPSRMLVRTRASADPQTQSLLPAGGAYAAYRLAVKLGSVLGYPDAYLPTGRTLLRHPWLRQAEVLNLHNLHGNYFPLPQLVPLSQQKPVVWTLHDMWSFTGHCGYSFTCERWQQGCGNCPALQTPPPLRRDTTRTLWQLRRHVYARSNLMLVAPSRWLASLAAQSPLLSRFPIHAIPNSVDTDIFRPQARPDLRARLQLPSHKPLLLFMSYQLEDDRKGGDILHEALLRLAARPGAPSFEILLLGHGQIAAHTALPFRVHSLGHLTSEADLAAYYAAADLFILPSRQDNLPNGLLESLACGTPLIGFDVGGVGEVVRHQQTGFLVPEVGAEALTEAIQWSLENPAARAQWGQNCRNIALAEYALRVQAQAYETIYRRACDPVLRAAGK